MQLTEAETALAKRTREVGNYKSELEALHVALSEAHQRATSTDSAAQPPRRVTAVVCKSLLLPDHIVSCKRGCVRCCSPGIC